MPNKHGKLPGGQTGRPPHRARTAGQHSLKGQTEKKRHSAFARRTMSGGSEAAAEASFFCTCIPLASATEWEPSSAYSRMFVTAAVTRLFLLKLAAAAFIMNEVVQSQRALNTFEG